MKNIYILLLSLILLTSCSNDFIFDKSTDQDDVIEIPCQIDCKINLVQVTSNNIHLTITSSNITIDCSKSGLVFDVVRNSSNKIIQYKIFKCD